LVFFFVFFFGFYLVFLVFWFLVFSFVLEIGFGVAGAVATGEEGLVVVRVEGGR